MDVRTETPARFASASLVGCSRTGKGQRVEIGEPTVELRNGNARWEVEVRGLPIGPQILWYEVSEEHEPLLTLRSDPALVALAVVAMRTGERISVRGG